MTQAQRRIVAKAFPEVGAGGYTRVDGTVEFYGRVRALLQSDFRVLDYGAGRAAWFEDDMCDYRREIRTVRGRVQEYIVCDIDDAVLANKSADRVVHIGADEPLPFESESLDLVIADYVFEHLDEPEHVSRELERVLRPGAWLCARTPNSLGYVALASRLLKNAWHVPLLGRIQPGRKDLDVFPTRYRLNTLTEVRKYFPSERFDNYSYRYSPEPAYFFESKALFMLTQGIEALLPPMFSSQLFIFLRKIP